MTTADRPPSDSAPCPSDTAAGVLDVADGAARLLGDRALYVQMLTRFRDDYRHCAAALRGAIGRGDLEAAERMAHTLKGASGLIGAPSLYLQASLLELALPHRAPGQDDAVATVERALEQVMAAIDRELAGEPGGAALPASSALPADRALLAQLGTLLDRGDGSALEVLEASRTRLAAALGEAKLGEVERAAHRFDFEAALDALSGADEEPD